MAFRLSFTFWITWCAWVIVYWHYCTYTRHICMILEWIDMVLLSLDRLLWLLDWFVWLLASVLHQLTTAQTMDRTRSKGNCASQNGFLNPRVLAFKTSVLTAEVPCKAAQLVEFKLLPKNSTPTNQALIERTCYAWLGMLEIYQESVSALWGQTEHASSTSSIKFSFTPLIIIQRFTVSVRVEVAL